MLKHPTSKQREIVRTQASEPTEPCDDMNPSQSEQNFGQRSVSEGMDRVSEPSRFSSPRINRFLQGSWDGGSTPVQGNKKSHQKNVPGPPLAVDDLVSPTSSPMTALVSTMPFSPTTPGKHSVSIKPSSLPHLPITTEGSKKSRQSSLLEKLSSGSNHLIAEATVPTLYKHARKGHWAEVSRILEKSSKDVNYVYKKDGTTILHLAVMSRTGYMNAFKSSSKILSRAPAEIVKTLLEFNPDLAMIKCTLNGYTPLTYACLVCDEGYDVEDSAKLVRLFLEHRPDSIHVLTKDGLSAVDIHVVSYSHHHKDKVDETSRGRTSASVLRTLLTHSPELAIGRIHGTRVVGPIELLYKCNAKAFSKAVMDEIYTSDDDEGTVRSDFTIPARRQKVVATVSKWWTWTWTVMVLKFGSIHQRKRGSQFAAVHAAAMQIGCPTPILSITLYAFPRQIKQCILDKYGMDNLPLHEVCSWPSGPEHRGQSLLGARRAQAISRVVEEYPQAAKSTNGSGETALEVAAKSGASWDSGIRKLVKAYPKALKIQSRRTGLYPFMTAAAAASPTASPTAQVNSLRTIYGLLRSNPKTLTQAVHRGRKQR